MTEQGAPVGIVGLGAVGARAARLLADGAAGVVVWDLDPETRAHVRARVGGVRVAPDLEALVEQVSVLVLACPGPEQATLAERAVRAGRSVVSTSGAPGVVAQLLALETLVVARGVQLVAGAGFAPGLACLLAAHAATQLDRVDGVEVASMGVGGAACRAEHHAARAASVEEWRGGSFRGVRPRGGSVLVPFPDPVGVRPARPCASGATALLQRAFPDSSRVVTREVGSWRGQFGPPALLGSRLRHTEDGLGAVTVEVRGWRSGSAEVVVLGALERPAVAAGAVAAAAARWVQQDRLGGPGVGGLASVVPNPTGLLGELAATGVRAATLAPVEAG